METFPRNLNCQQIANGHSCMMRIHTKPEYLLTANNGIRRSSKPPLWAMHLVLYQRIAMVIETTKECGTFC